MAQSTVKRTYIQYVTMSETILKCEYKDCPWKSEKYAVDICLKLLEIHITAHHAPAPTHHAKPSQATAKPEKAKRPEMAAELSDEDWAYFLSRWEEYKLATALTGDDVVIQLMECCCEQLRREHHRTFPKGDGGAVTETKKLEQLKQLCVRKKNRAVNRVKLGTMKQDKGEPVRKFAGRVMSLANVSEYSVACSKCQHSILKL